MNIQTNQTEKILGITEDEMDAMQYITASKIIQLKNKYKDPELRILWERAYAKRMIKAMQDKLHVYEHGYRAALPMTILLGLLSGMAGWLWDFTIPLHSTIAFALGSLQLFNLFVFGKTVLLFKKGKGYKADRDQEITNALLEYYKPVQDEAKGEWLPVKQASERCGISMAMMGKLLKKNGFLKKRDKQFTYFLAKKVEKDLPPA